MYFGLGLRARAPGYPRRDLALKRGARRKNCLGRLLVFEIWQTSSRKTRWLHRVMPLDIS